MFLLYVSQVFLSNHDGFLYLFCFIFTFKIYFFILDKMCDLMAYQLSSAFVSCNVIQLICWNSAFIWSYKQFLKSNLFPSSCVGFHAFKYRLKYNTSWLLCQIGTTVLYLRLSFHYLLIRDLKYWVADPPVSGYFCNHLK